MMDNGETMVVKAHELLTLQDLEVIMRAEGCSVRGQWPASEHPSATVLQNMASFNGGLRMASQFASLPQEQRWMFDGLLHTVQEIANEGWRTMYSSYVTQEQKSACVIAFWPVHRSHGGELRVPCRFGDLMNQNVASYMMPGQEQSEC